MNTLANVLKQQAANVPVVYTWTPSGSFFTNYSHEGGFDGLAVATRPGEPSRLARTTGPAYSQAEQSARTTWFLAARSRPPRPPTTGPKVSPSPLPMPRRLLPCPQPLTPAKRCSPATWMTCGVSAAKGFSSTVCKAVRPSRLRRQMDSTDWIANPDSLTWLRRVCHMLHNPIIAPPRSAHVSCSTRKTHPAPRTRGLVPGTSGRVLAARRVCRRRHGFVAVLPGL